MRMMIGTGNPSVVFCPLFFDKIWHLLMLFDKPVGFEEVLSCGLASRDWSRGRHLEEIAS